MSLNITGKRVLIRNVLWNSLGTAGPLIAAIVAIPLLISALGTARFGILTIVWMVVGYFSMFDLGLGRALTKLVAERIGTARDYEIPSLFWHAMGLMAGVGIAGAVILALACKWLVFNGLAIPAELQDETVSAIYVLALSVPIVVVSTGLRGLLEAYQRFDLVTYVRLPVGVLTYLAPLVAVQFSPNLGVVVVALLVTRAVAVVTYLLASIFNVPGLTKWGSSGDSCARELLSFGGWMTVSNLVGPLLLYLGRLFVAVLVSAEAVAYFVTPYEIVTRLLLVPGIIVGVLFPAFSHLQETNPEQGRRLFRQANLAVAAILLLPVVFIIAFADWGLAIWINDEFARNGSVVARLLALGVFVNSFGHIAQALIQGYGRPDWTAKLHMLELAIYVPYLWWLTNRYGIEGAALAWVIRVAISTVVLSIMASKGLSYAANNMDQRNYK